MLWSIFRTFSLVLVFALCPAHPGTAQQNSPGDHNAAPLTNQDIVLMTRSKFDDATIVKTIHTFHANFDLSVAALMKLKDAGVTQTVMQAMLAKGTDGGKALSPEQLNSSVTTVSTVSPNLLEEVGVFVRKQAKLVAMEPEIVNWRTGGVLKSMATAGLDKGHVNGSIAGPHSNFKLTSSSFMGYDMLEFFFRRCTRICKSAQLAGVSETTCFGV